MQWQIRDRNLTFGRPLIMGILNVTPDSFSDGGRFFAVDGARRQAERMVAEGVDILDVGGESTRPGGERVSAEDEIARVIPIIDKIRSEHALPISIDTTKSKVAEAALDAGADIVNDISGLRFDERIADVVEATGCGLVLMHSRGSFETMHSQPPLNDIFTEVTTEFQRSIGTARDKGVRDEQIVLDVGLGFGKTQSQNLELIAKLDKLKAEFSGFPFLIGASRKSFIGKLLDGASSDKRLGGSIAAAVVAAWNGADILRVHDVKETVDALRLVQAIKDLL